MPAYDTGWRDAQGKLWAPNTIVSVNLPNAKTRADRCIAEVTFMRGEEGTQTMLTVMPTEALLPQPFAVRPVTPS